MANYPIKMLKDEGGTPFVPLVSTQGVRDPDGKTVQQILDTKLSPENLHGGQNVTITTQDDDCYINVEFPPSGTLIDNLSTTTANQGALDAHQGYELKNMIPEVVNNLTTVDSTKALSAYQGYLLSNRVVPVGGIEGQILIKNSNADNDVAWTSDYLPLSGGTLTGKVTFAVAGREDSNVAGFTYDQYGNLTHKRDSVTDSLQIKNYAGSKTIGFSPESGDIEAVGNITAKRLYQIGGPEFLPSGDGTDPAYWCALPNGTYFHTNTDGVSNMPETYGFVTKDGYYATDGSKGDFTIIFQKQATGTIYRTSGNHNTTICTWRKLIYEDEITAYNSYSTNEVFTGKYLLGTTPIYRKWISGTSPVDGSAITLASSVDYIVDSHFMIKRKNTAQYHELTSCMTNFDTSHASPLFYNSNAKAIQLYITNATYQSQDMYGWVEYTKSS